jgi:NADH-quinone oxidoreductase subunit E
MNNNESSLICLAGGWGLALLAALLAAVMLMVLGDWRLIQAIFAGVVIFIIVGALVSWIACKPLPAPKTSVQPKSDERPVKSSAESAAEAAAAAKAGASAAPPVPDAPAAAASSPAAAAAAAKAGVKASTPLAGEAELAGRKGAWRYESGKAAPKAAPAAKAEGGSKPAKLDGPRGGTADNLKEIKGVGPKLEQLLNSMGFYHFDQIANWSAEEVAWVDANLEGFKGRVSRDDWVAQAKILASGGETEFSKRVDDGNVY